MAGSGDKKSYTWVIVLVVILLVIVGILLAMKKKAAKTGGFYGGKEKSDASHLMLPAGQGPHTHEVDLDETGSGVSTCADSHRHVVEKTIDIGLEQNGDVSPADHHHDVTAYIVDADPRAKN